MFLLEYWFKVVKEANLRKPFEVTEMEQTNFMDWKSHLEQKYKLDKKDINGNPKRLCEVHWLNFGWGDEIDGATSETVLRHHPGEERFVQNGTMDEDKDPHMSKPYHYTSTRSASAGKINDLKAMARKYILAPQKDFYLNLQASDREDNGE